MKNAKKTCVVVTGGEFSDFSCLQESEIVNIRNADFVIACDHGFDYCEKLGLKPNLVLGDFDSIAALPDFGKIQVERLPCEKDDTDTMAAARYCVQNGFSSVYFLCAFGGRLDHSVANFQTMLFLKKNGVDCYAYGVGTVCTIISDETKIFPRRKNFSFSAFSFGEKTLGVSISGAKYSVSDAELICDFPIGVSNEWADGSNQISVTVESGYLFIMECSCYFP